MHFKVRSSCHSPIFEEFSLHHLLDDALRDAWIDTQGMDIVMCKKCANGKRPFLVCTYMYANVQMGRLPLS